MPCICVCMHVGSEIGPFAQCEEPLGRAKVAAVLQLSPLILKVLIHPGGFITLNLFQKKKQSNEHYCCKYDEISCGKWGAGLTLEHNGEKALVRAAKIRSLKSSGSGNLRLCRFEHVYSVRISFHTQRTPVRSVFHNLLKTETTFGKTL